MVRIEVRPAGRTQPFLERLAELCREGKITRLGFPRPVAAAELVLEYSDTGHGAKPSLRAQRTVAGLVMAVAHPMAPYLFVDEWDVAAPPDAVFEALADTRTYPQWWRPVYLGAQSDGPVELGTASEQHFKGRLPYHLHTRSVIAELDPPRRVTADVDGDLRGRGSVDADADARGRHARPVRLAGIRRSQAAPRVHAGAAAGVPLEPQLGDRARDRRSRAVRAAFGGRGSGLDADHVTEHVVDRDRAGAVLERLDRCDERGADASLADRAGGPCPAGGRE